MELFCTNISKDKLVLLIFSCRLWSKVSVSQFSLVYLRKKIYRQMRYFAVRNPPHYRDLGFLIIVYYLMIGNEFMCKISMNDYFARLIEFCKKKVKQTFLSSEPVPDYFYKILFYGEMVDYGTFFCVQFHVRLWRIESQT